MRPADCEPVFLRRWLVLPKQQDVVHDGDSDTKSIFKAQDTCRHRGKWLDILEWKLNVKNFVSYGNGY